MAIDTQALGRTFEPHTYVVGREEIGAYALAVGDTNPLYLEPDAARRAGHRDLVAPPMFAVVYCSSAIHQALFDPAVGIDFAMLVHGAQEFEWGPLVLAGDEITTQVAVAEIYERLGMAFYVFESRSANRHGAEVCRGRWTQIVRPRP